MAVDDRNLPGRPSRLLVRRVRSHLSLYGIRPKDREWIATWQWAYAIANSYWREHWPLATEIGTQYIVLLLAAMKENHALKMPFRSEVGMPERLTAIAGTRPDSKLLSLTNLKSTPQAGVANSC